MKTPLIFATIIACTLSSPLVSAQEKATLAKPMMVTEKPTPTDKQMPQMQDNMKKMQQQMEKIDATTDPKLRQKLMQEHMQTMQENMKAMRRTEDMANSMGSAMMGDETHSGMANSDSKAMAKGKHKDMADGDMMKHHNMMKQRMDMMQMMMEQMMQHQKVQESMSK